MKKILISFLIIFLTFTTVGFFKREKPDPYYLNSEPLDYMNINKKDEKHKDIRTINEKFREKLHLPPTKKVYLHNIDKSKMPVSLEDYYKLSIDKKRSEFEIPLPKFEPKDDIIVPNPHFRVISYNTPPGQRNIDLSQLVAQRSVSSPGILSPDKTKLVYTKAFFYPKHDQTASSVYVIPIDPKLVDAYDALYRTNVMQGNQESIFSVGMDEVVQSQFRTLFPIDWSKDSKKIAFKEKIGSNYAETWKTNIIIYDFETSSWKRLTAVREAIIYWWRHNKQIELKDYMWDIFPIGWDKNNPDRMLVYAYAFTKEQPLFLGTWSIDFNEEKSKLESINSTNQEVDLNGYGLKEIKLIH